jgi:mono/diheme cytochrome c family protein
MVTCDLRADFDRLESHAGRRRRTCRGAPENRSTGAKIIEVAGTSSATTGGRWIYLTGVCSNARAHRPTAPAALMLAALAIVAPAPHAFAQGPSLRPPAFTEGQVERGKSIYQKNCQDCHGSTLDNGEFGGAPLKGSYFRQHWGSGDVSALFGYVNALMPPDRPGQLSEQSYVDLTAFLLSSNGYAAGPEELTADQDAQRKMTMKR